MFKPSEVSPAIQAIVDSSPSGMYAINDIYLRHSAKKGK